MADLQSTKHLIEIIRELCFATTLDSVMTLVGVAARQLTHADGATFVLRQGEECFYAHENAIAPLWQGQRFPLDHCICGWAMTHQQVAMIEDVYSDARIPVEAYAPTFVKSLTIVPMHHPTPLGAVGVYWAERHQPLSQEVDLLQVLADTTATVLEKLLPQALEPRPSPSRLQELEVQNARLRAELLQRHTTEYKLRRLSLTDALTGLHNRRSFFVLANQQFKLAQRQQQVVGVLFIDLDYLKQVNDHYGHDAGDWLIVNAAQLLRNTCRESDIVARLGGDEFVIFVADCTDGTEIVSRLQANANAFNQTHDRPYQLSMSVGLALSHRTDINPSLRKLIAQADAAMYAAKQANRQPAVDVTAS